MKYFRTEIETVNGQTAQAIYDRDNLRTALSEHYSVLASALANENCTEVLSEVKNYDGGVYAQSHYNMSQFEQEE